MVENLKFIQNSDGTYHISCFRTLDDGSHCLLEIPRADVTWGLGFENLYFQLPQPQAVNPLIYDLKHNQSANITFLD